MKEINPDYDPTLIVETDGVSIEVTDATTAEAALPFVEGILEYYLGGVDEGVRQGYASHEPVEVSCDKCGYEWTYRGRQPNGATCPDCNRHTSIDADTLDRR